MTRAKRLLFLYQQQNVNQPITDSLVLWVDGKDFTNTPNTTSWTDKSGSGNNLTPTNFEYTASSGSDGAGGVVFDGTNDNITTPVHPTISGFTLQVKFKLTATNSLKMQLINYTNGGLYTPNYNGFAVAINANSTVLRIETADSAREISFSLNETNVFAMSWANGVQQLYFNGALIHSVTSTSVNINANTKIQIGRYPNGNEYFRGTIYSVVINNKVLTSA
jgi:hypothetical protein